MPNIMYLENKNLENYLENSKKITAGNWIINKKGKKSIPRKEKKNLMVLNAHWVKINGCHTIIE